MCMTHWWSNCLVSWYVICLTRGTRRGGLGEDCWTGTEAVFFWDFALCYQRFPPNSQARWRWIWTCIQGKYFSLIGCVSESQFLFGQKNSKSYHALFGFSFQELMFFFSSCAWEEELMIICISLSLLFFLINIVVIILSATAFWILNTIMHIIGIK